MNIIKIKNRSTRHPDSLIEETELGKPIYQLGKANVLARPKTNMSDRVQEVKRVHKHNKQLVQRINKIALGGEPQPNQAKLHRA